MASVIFYIFEVIYFKNDLAFLIIGSFIYLVYLKGQRVK